ncbi:hypothetical protein IMG5_002490 [Ichthyophthirius multifiliis]|uniref:Transmembrane protein n=1 Tax=Ichthyophthirius multifiliis TaxID=5932 RepID=G0QJ53_ICHMU|nr:hypothetical protein IMG5_002490 [Ichthyophthirius multifiliis]EGR34777.1 hypothetical protein IMG5_002490 [Ichthyophthirius multifiliis]|eukprot:XP_004040081.1 hypothetical protein IMG5_002490 [Ichthyophthirius multifiliis]
MINLSKNKNNNSIEISSKVNLNDQKNQNGFDILEAGHKIWSDANKRNFINLFIKQGRFLLEFTLDLFIVFPLYLIKMIWVAFITIKQAHQERRPYIVLLKIAGAFFLDIILPLSIVGISFKTVQGQLFDYSHNVYQIWCENCFLFFISFILLLTYLSAQNEKESQPFSCSFQYLLRQEHLQVLGLGVIHSNLLKQLKIEVGNQNGYGEYVSNINPNARNSNVGKLQNIEQSNFYRCVDEIAKELQIDLTLFYFDLLDNSLASSTTQNLEDQQKKLIQQLESIGCRARLNAKEKILWPIYDQICNTQQAEVAPFFVFALIICIKVILPFWFILKMDKVDSDFVSILLICGFYIYMISILYPTMNNADLRRRLLIVKNVSMLCDFKDAKDEDFVRRIDITCPVSIETWDNSRRIGFQLDKHNTVQFELSYIFLGIYYMFLALVCCSIYGNIYIIIKRDSIYLHPLLVIHTTVDFLLITIFFFLRIWYSTEFNSSFQEQTILLDELIGIYDDLIQMFDCYFTEGIIGQAKNPIYKKIVKQIKSKAKLYIQRQYPLRGKIYTDEKKFELNLVIQLRMSLENIRKQIVLDDKINQHKIFGILPLSFGETFSTVSLGLMTAMPVVLNKLDSIFKKYD